MYNALQQETVIKFGELLSEKQQEELRTAVEKLRRQMLRKSREYDCQILQERMELLQQAHQVRTESLHRCRVGTKQMGLSTKYLVLSMGVEKPRSYKLFSESKITVVFHLDSERGQFCNDSVF